MLVGGSLGPTGAGAVTANALSAATYTNALTFNNASNAFTGSGAGLTALNFANISGTNTGALTIGNGGALGPSGTGTITANALAAATYGNILTFNNASNAFTGSFTGSGANLTAVPASVLTGAALPAGLTTSSLTTLGTLSALNVTGTSTLAGTTNINASNNAATNIGTGSTTSTVSIGNAANTVAITGGTTNVTGITNIKGVTGINVSNNAATNIGTGTTTSTVSVGNSANTVAIAGGTNTISGTTNTVTGTTNTVTGTTNNVTGLTNINAGNNAVTNIGTGSTTSTVNIGGGSNDVVIGNTNGVAIVASNGHVRTIGASPTTSSCGGGTITITGTDVAGRLDDGNSANYTTCIIDFASTWAAAPTCMVQQTTGTKTTFLASASTTQLTISGLGNSRNRSFAWICMQ